MFLRKYFTGCNIYTALWCIMHLKGTLYSMDIISVIAYMGAMAMSACCFFQVLNGTLGPNGKVLRALNILTFMFIFYGAVNILVFDPIVTSWNVIPTDFYLKNILNSILPIYAYYNYAKQGQINGNWIRSWVILFVGIAMCRYFYNERHLLETVFEGQYEITNNAGYFFVAILPGIVFWNKKPIIQYSLLAICMLFILAAMKRGAVLAGGLCMIVFFILNMSKGVSTGRKIITLLLGAAVLYIGIIYIEQMMANSDYFYRRFQDTMDGNSSSRDGLYNTFFRMIVDGNPINMLIGYGADGTVRNGPNYAHNDWLEIGVNQGLLGVLIFLNYWMVVYKFWRSTKFSQTIYISMAIFFVGAFIKTFFSMSINNMEIYSTAIFGYLIAVMNSDTIPEELIDE